jgi:hypothetical protein
MSIVRLTPLSLLVLLLALAVVPVKADEKVTVGDVTFECKIDGSSKDNYDILATNRGKTEKKCKASCTLTKKDGSPYAGKEYEHTVLVTSAIQNFYSESVPGAELSNPQVKASCP